jgi:hypothetical protein
MFLRVGNTTMSLGLSVVEIVVVGVVSKASLSYLDVVTVWIILEHFYFIDLIMLVFHFNYHILTVIFILCSYSWQIIYYGTNYILS